MTCAMGGPRRRCSESHKVIWGLSPCVCARLESRVSFVEKRKTDMSGAGRRDKGTVLEYTKVYIYIPTHSRDLSVLSAQFSNGFSKERWI